MTTTTWVRLASRPADGPTPDHVPCRHCAYLISWGRICWTHDATGSPVCGPRVALVGRRRAVAVPGLDRTYAEPVGEWW